LTTAFTASVKKCLLLLSGEHKYIDHCILDLFDTATCFGCRLQIPFVRTAETRSRVEFNEVQDPYLCLSDSKK